MDGLKLHQLNIVRYLITDKKSLRIISLEGTGYYSFAEYSFPLLNHKKYMPQK